MGERGKAASGVGLGGAAGGMTGRIPPRRDGVITTAPPWMTAENPANPEPGTTERAVELHRLEEIVRTARLATTAAVRSAGRLKQRIEENLVAADQQPDEPFHGSSKGDEAPSAKRKQDSSGCGAARALPWKLELLTRNFPRWHWELPTWNPEAPAASPGGANRSPAPRSSPQPIRGAGW